MRVALLPSAYAPAVGGVEELTERLARQLLDASHEVEVWTIHHPSELPRTETIRGIKVRRFTQPLPGATVHDASAFIPRAVRALGRLGRATRTFSPDVLHVQCFSANGVYAAALSRLMRVPLVVTLQGETVMDDHDIYDRSASLRIGLRIGLRQASAVTGCSRFVLEDAVRRFGLAPDDGVVVPNGVEISEREPEVPLDMPPGRFVLGLGRVVAKKGFDLLLDAFAEVARTHTDVSLLIGGDGAARDPLAAKVRALGLENRVLLPGSLSRGQVRWAMRNATVFVLPSRVEPFGIVVLEALAAGVPSIVSVHGGATEIVHDEREALVVDPFDSGELSAAIMKLLEDEPLRRRLARAGESRVRVFGWRTVSESYLEIYRQVAGASASGAPMAGREE